MVTGERSANIARPGTPAGDGGAIEPVGLSAATTAGFARPPEPKNASVEVSKPSTVPRSAATKMLSGAPSCASGAWATDSVLVAESYAGAPVPRQVCWLAAGMYGSTSQYSYHDALRACGPGLRMTTSCRSTGSSPNGE